MDPTAAKLAWSKARRIHGWFSVEAGMLLAWFDDMQKRSEIVGDLFEIGVHHGRSSVFLASMLNVETEKLGVCDLFGRQSENVSGSGSGSRAIFDANIAPDVARGARIDVHARASSELRADDIGTRHRLFHIDGGHTAEETLSDLRLAESASREDGIVVLDDAINSVWPGVAEGLFRYLWESQAMRPIAIGFNKLVLANVRHADRFREQLANTDARDAYGLGYPWHLKELDVGGVPTTIFYIPTYVATGPLARLAHRLHR